MTTANPIGKPIEASDEGVAALRRPPLGDVEMAEPTQPPTLGYQTPKQTRSVPASDENTDVVLVLSDGRTVTLHEPKASTLRGLKLVDILQLDTQAHAPLVERISDLGVADFYALGAADTMAVMAGVVSFFESGLVER